MCPGEWEFRFGVVEFGWLPAGSAVTGIAEDAKLALVGVILGMAGVTSRLDFDELVVQMTL